MNTPPDDRLLRAGRLFYSLLLGLAAAFFAWKTIHWRWMWDDSVMHYGNFLMNHGMVLYRDIIDMNMPGSYFIEGWAIHIFGGGDLAARMYEFFLLALLTASMIVIAWPYEWFAGLFAGVIFLLVHGSEGPVNAVEREEIMTVLIVAAFACVFVALRRRSPLLMLPFGFLAGLATSLKPTAAPLGLVVLILAAVELRRRRTGMLPYLSFGCAGLLAATLVVVNFFLSNHAFASFLEIMRRLLPYYAGLQKTPFRVMLRDLTTHSLLLLFVVALIMILAHRDWKNWERGALAFGVCFGVFSYFAQHKGFAYHRYPFLAFALLWTGLEFAWAARRTGWLRVAGLAGFTLGVFYVVPVYAYRLAHDRVTTALPDALEHDLALLGGQDLQHQVQCLDMVSGCVTALYHLQLVQSTGFLGDLMLFPARGYAPSPFYRDLFWKGLQERRPLVFIVTSAWFNEHPSFDKLDQWPQFADLLKSDYSLLVTRDFNAETEVMGPISYRIYVLKSSNLMVRARNPW